MSISRKILALAIKLHAAHIRRNVAKAEDRVNKHDARCNTMRLAIASCQSVLDAEHDKLHEAAAEAYTERQAAQLMLDRMNSI